MLYVILIWPGSISGIFSRVPRSPVWAAQIASLFRLRERSPALAITGAHHTRVGKFLWNQENMIYFWPVKNMEQLFIDKHFRCMMKLSKCQTDILWPSLSRPADNILRYFLILHNFFVFQKKLKAIIKYGACNNWYTSYIMNCFQSCNAVHQVMAALNVVTREMSGWVSVGTHGAQSELGNLLSRSLYHQSSHLSREQDVKQSSSPSAVRKLSWKTEVLSEIKLGMFLSEVRKKK